MLRLSSIILIILTGLSPMWSQSPHGKELMMDCALCHNSSGWDFDAASSTFNHDSTEYVLLGQHRDLDCRSCHTSLVFKEAETSCISCHKDIHQQTLGSDCARCHTPQSWIVSNITQLHEQISFPLMGVHATVDCNKCHQSETNVRFSPTGVECINCHRSDYNDAQKPNHIKNNFSLDCASCHGLDGDAWNTEIVDHNFFPLQDGHSIKDCAACHKSDDYSMINAACISCHQTDYNNTTQPNHLLSGFSTECAGCHTLKAGWKPVTFSNHDNQFFPIYSGKHMGVWNQCSECHTNNNFKEFTCVSCHKNPETNDVHTGINGYNYSDNACLGCHPTGDADMAFDHNTTQFPLTGAHNAVQCLNCHANGYKGTSTICADCHTTDFNLSTNPNHTLLGLSKDCATCHTTQSGWAPAAFPDHNSFFALNGAHAVISNNCTSCHNGNYGTTPNTCVGCHNNDYIETTDPNHVVLQFSTDCATCHSESAWKPSTFNHDGMYFPVYSGKHMGQWTQCTDCHTSPGNWSEFTCITCHQNDITRTQHAGINGYAYFSPACLACHPTGSADNIFDHNTTSFPLTGAHITTECLSCHSGGFTGTTTTCVNCHANDFSHSTNPNHPNLNITTDCALCHTTNPGWSPATFPMHNQFYVLNGAHANISADCVSCHNGNYTNTPNTCIGCHKSDYDATTDPNHAVLQFPAECSSCHSENSWKPSTFNHDAQYFPIYSGKHFGQWNQCLDCHSNPSNYSQFTCINCHQNPETNNQHQGVSGYVYNNATCFACHPTGDADNVFNHNNTAFPLTGAHMTTECTACHTNGFSNIPTSCSSCHQADYNSSLNPNHIALNLSNDCAICHTTAPGWSPATFPNHDNFYVITGAHTAIANDCATCHNGNYNNTPNTCVGCHQTDYNNTTNPNHISALFPTNCTTCHSQNAWSPSTFDHNTFYPLTGAHAAVASNCTACHANGYTDTPNTCVGCHQANYDTSLNPNHSSLGISNDCATCHTTAPGWSPAAFPNHDNFYVITGAHTAIANDCAACHNGNYNNTPNTCIGCHQANFNNTTNPDHEVQLFPTNCTDCHTQNTWIPSTFDHNVYYPLIGAHAGIASNCVTCHNGNYNNTPNTCVGCHQTDFNNTTNPNHISALFPTNCTTCHSQNAWSPSTFDHNTFYPLTGGHAAVASNCTACHANGYINTPNTCVGCHQADYNTSLNPNHSSLGISNDCATCHTTAPGWSPATFPIHDNFYVITGAHTAIANDCAACHNGNYNTTPNTCIGCHQTDYNNTTNPDHAAAQFPTNCTTCHTQNAWTPSTFDHNTFYPLTGAHAAVVSNCTACHANGYTNTPNTCVGCHQADYNTSLNPNHSSLGISSDCATCHSTAPGWSPATFPIHDNFYVITGAHTAIANDCAACHNGNYNTTPNTCIGCHQTDYNNTTNPDHAAAQFPTNCTTCHTQNAWTPSTFDHNTFYPLTGAHAAVASNCTVCHANGYTNTPNTCVGCHQADYNTSLNPNHSSLGISNDCATCHTTAPGWSPATFPIHDNFYVITGAHTAIANDCAACHNGNYNNTPNTCVGCHQSDYNSTTNPNHTAAQFPTNCTTCHTQNAWTPSTFDHNVYYPLVGAHAAIANNCVTCHNGNYNNTPNTCIGCHQTDFNNTTNPDHEMGMFPTDCTTCHSQNAWVPSTFDHNIFYPLTGGHAAVASNCIACHANGYTNTPNTCVGCHQSDYNTSINPNHSSLGISNDCATCHTTTPGWSPASFPIHNNFYVITGAHTAIANDCAACHNGNYNNTPNTCVGCHQADYNATTNPNHAAAQFPTNCTTCHTQNAWTPSTFNHNVYYPLTGAHSNIATNCILCHSNGYTNTPNTCAGCHQPDYNTAQNPNHLSLNLSNDCVTCHTTAPGWAPAGMPNHSTYYVIAGAHVSLSCIECHNGNYNNTPNTCYGCHASDYNGATQPNHAAAQFPTDCAACHTQSAWVPSNFNHDNMYFPIYSGKHDDEWNQCIECHINPNNYAVFSCINCHEHSNQSEVNQDHQGVNGYQYNSNACYACHPDGED